jgi:hypothetical protein
LLIKSGVKTGFLWVCEECPDFWRKKDGQSTLTATKAATDLGVMTRFHHLKLDLMANDINLRKLLI